MRIDFFGLMQKIRVPCGFLCSVLFLIFSRPTPRFAVAGFLIASAGAGLRLWAAGCIEKSRELEVRGPYQYTRNPLYFGSFLVGLGGFIAAARIELMLIFVALFACIYGPVMKREEEEMLSLFPDMFPDYRRAVPRFIPQLRRGGAQRPQSDFSMESGVSGFGDAAARESRFRWSRFWRNREYNAL
ncbi:MAG: isoprenylcysteine carboxylmethyltransferase family protein, partial [Acidobacteria bacterium]|nr:isoprenylcysteine carboxylmethyltransferase family protein [Acidobacteriota bacterium]